MGKINDATDVVVLLTIALDWPWICTRLELRKETSTSQWLASRSIRTLPPALPKTKTSPATEVDGNAVAKLFDEIKVMFRDLPERLHGQIHEVLDLEADASADCIQ